MSVLSMIANAITPAVSEQIGRRLGISSAMVQKGLNAAIPVLLAAVLGKAKQGGGSILSSILTPDTPDQHGGIAAALENDPGRFAGTGMSMLKGLLGDSTADQLAAKLDSFAGTGGQGSAAGQLLGLGSAAVMGGLNQTARERSLDGGGLLSLLESEKDEIARAVPADFAREIRGMGLLDHVPQAAAEAPRAAANKVSAPAPSSRPSWVPWVIAALAALLLLLLVPRFMGSGDVEPETAAVPADAVAGDPAAEVTSGLDQLSAILARVTDAESATAAQPELEGLQSQLGAVASNFGGLPEEVRAPVSTAVSDALPQLSSAIQSLLGDSAIAAVIGPVLESILGSLQEMTAA